MEPNEFTEQEARWWHLPDNRRTQDFWEFEREWYTDIIEPLELLMDGKVTSFDPMVSLQYEAEEGERKPTHQMPVSICRKVLQIPGKVKEDLGQQIQEEIDRIEADEVYQLPTATTFENAPRALIQADMESRVRALQWVLHIMHNKQ
jgi:hypothetical protein